MIEVEEPTERHHYEPGRDWVALILAIGLATAINLVTIGVLIAAWYRGSRTGDYALSENATQVMIAAFGGLIGILGGYVGGRQVERATKAQTSANVERDQLLLNATPITEEPAKVDIVGTVDVDTGDDEGGTPP